MQFQLKPFRIGEVEIAMPVVLAALAGYTDVAFRMICRRFGAAYTATEMILDRLILHRSRQTSKMLVTDPADHPISGQLVGNDPQTMADAAVAMGAMGFDVIDLNFACPVRKALARRRGGFLMSQPELAVEIAREVVAASGRPVTLKLRQKFRSADDESNFWRIADGAFDAGVAAICVHARSVEVKYRGPADWDFLAKVRKRFPDKIVIGSGDVASPQAALDMLDQVGMDGASAARGALGNPWFFRQVRELAEGKTPDKPALAEQRQVLADHYAAALALHGPLKTHKVMRAHGVKYASLHEHPKRLRVAFVNIKSDNEWQKILDDHYPPL
ncbi:MAG: tRNA-dihydrouridine synthase family protein [Planctomycetes bacterium]|nr:tRNA-dihydrouridine synthase family protein [Planctomycetota bacterium]